MDSDVLLYGYIPSVEELVGMPTGRLRALTAQLSMDARHELSRSTLLTNLIEHYHPDELRSNPLVLRRLQLLLLDASPAALLTRMGRQHPLGVGLALVWAANALTPTLNHPPTAASWWSPTALSCWLG